MGMGTDGGDVSKISGKLTLIIMDGVGLSPYREGNAFQQANTPTLDRLMASCRMTTLAALRQIVIRFPPKILISI